MPLSKLNLIVSVSILSLLYNVAIVYCHQHIHGIGHRTCGTLEKTQILMAKSPEYKQKHELENKRADEYVEYMKNTKNHVFHKNVQTNKQHEKKSGKKLNPKYLKKHGRKDEYAQSMKDLLLQSQKRSLYSEYDDMIDKEPIILIPIVFHVLYSNSDENLSDAQLDSQITVLNKDFRAANDEIVNGEVPTIWQDRIGDAKIEFYINETKRIAISNAYEFCSKDSSIKLSEKGGSDAVDPKHFLNIWICDLSSQGKLGYAAMPCALDTSYEWQDGVVLDVYNVGSIDYDTDSSNPFYFGSSFFNLGRTATHEVGHYLNLHHIWGRSDGKSCETSISDDFVSDTPVIFEANGGCPNSSTNTCNVTDPETGTDLRDMYENFMDYTDDRCMFIFTEEQVWRMRSTLSGTGCRQELYYQGAQLTNTTYQTLQPSTPRTTGPTFACDDGCSIDPNAVDDGTCDCSNCDDEPSYNCTTCAEGCPTICGDWTECETNGGSGGGTGGIDNMFVCDDGCTVLSSVTDDGYCDCTNCEDESSYTCNTCNQGCPTACYEYTHCLDDSGNNIPDTTSSSNDNNNTPSPTTAITNNNTPAPTTTDTNNNNNNGDGDGNNSSFTCNDGCSIAATSINDDICDCTQCEDEQTTNWTCATCSFGMKFKYNEGCPTDCSQYQAYGGVYCAFDQQYLDDHNATMSEIAFECDDGCLLPKTYENDNQCDCSNCEDEPDWTCQLCIAANGANGTCPTTCDSKDWQPLICSIDITTTSNTTGTSAAVIHNVKSIFQLIIVNFIALQLM